MFEVGVVGGFEAAHRLRGDFGPATRTHGHTYRVEVTVRGDGLDENATLCDIAHLRDLVDGVTGALHLRDLDDVDAFEAANTTAETVARVIAEQVAGGLRGAPQLRAVHVRVWESPGAFAACEVALG